MLLGAALPAARAQGQVGPAYFLRHPAGGPPRPGLRLVGAGPAAAPALRATWGAAAGVAVPAYRPLAPAAGPMASSSVVGRPALPRRDATGVRPLYDLYGDLPEDFRRHTLPAAYVEPLPVQLLRGVLGR